MDHNKCYEVLRRIRCMFQIFYSVSFVGIEFQTSGKLLLQEYHYHIIQNNVMYVY